MTFQTHEEAILYAQENPGVVITRGSNQNEYIVKKTISNNTSKDMELIKNARQLLIDTKKELNYICSCILQTDIKTTNNLTKKAGEILTSKLGGIGAGTGVLGLISTFGTAGTGTAISTLSGAAATNATLAALGSIVGGGMFAGGILTIGIATGSGLLIHKFIKSKPREYDKLPSNEREIVDKCFILIKSIDEEVSGVVIPSNEKVQEFGKNDVVLLYKLLKENSNIIKSNLDFRNSTAFTLKAIPKFDKLIIRYSTI